MVIITQTFLVVGAEFFGSYIGDRYRNSSVLFVFFIGSIRDCMFRVNVS